MRGMTSTALPPIPMAYSHAGTKIAYEKPVNFTELELPSAPGTAALHAARIVVAFPAVEPEAGALERAVVYGGCLLFSLGCWATALGLVRALSRFL